MTDTSMPTQPDLDCDDVRDLAASYVLGALDAGENAAVEAHLASCADAHAEIAELASVIPILDASVPQVEPPVALKSRIMAAAAAEAQVSAVEAPGSVAAPPADIAPAAPVPFPSASEREERSARADRARTGRTSAVGWVMRIAAVVAIVGLAGWNLLLQGQLDQVRTYDQSVAAVLEVAASPGSLTAVLTPQDGAGPAGVAAVSASGDVTLAMRDLPATTGDEVYETWVIGGDGVPVALGGFPVGSSGTAYFEGTGLPTDPGIVLALTLEPAPGATAPGGPVVSLGTATAPG
jgi:anti-sigma-K factor RskA